MFSIEYALILGLVVSLRYASCVNSKTPTVSPSRKPTYSPSRMPSYLTTKVPSLRPSPAPTVTLTNNPTFSETMIMLLNVTWYIQGVHDGSSLQKKYLPALSRLFRTTTCQSLNITVDDCYCNYKTYGFQLINPTQSTNRLDSSLLSSPVPYTLHSIDSQHLKLRKDYKTAQDTTKFSLTPTAAMKRNSFLSMTSDYSNELIVMLHIPIPLTSLSATDSLTILEKYLDLVNIFIVNFVEDLSNPFQFLSTLTNTDPIDFAKNVTTIDEIDFAFSLVNEFLETNTADDTDDIANEEHHKKANNGTELFVILFPVLLGVMLLSCLGYYLYYKLVYKRKLKARILNSFQKLQDFDEEQSESRQSSHHTVQRAIEEGKVIYPNSVPPVLQTTRSMKYSKLVV